MEYTINEKVLKSTLNYLATKPYQEVAILITDLQKSTPIKKEENGSNEEETLSNK